LTEDFVWHDAAPNGKAPPEVAVSGTPFMQGEMIKKMRYLARGNASFGLLVKEGRV
jgi:hypothetical protein